MTELTKEEKENFEANMKWLIDLLKENPDSRFFGMQLDGQCYAKTKKRNARVSIAIPSDLGNTKNLKFLDDWKFLIIAIPKKDDNQ